MKGPPLRRSLATAALTLLLVMLPALVGGVRIDAPPTPAEADRVAAAMARGASTVRSLPAEMFYRATLPADAEDLDSDDRVVRARGAVILFLFGISGMTYLLLVLARRRTTALLACVALALLPVVRVEGYVLRPEVPAALFGGLSVVLAAVYAQLLRDRRGLRAIAPWLCAATVGATIGLAAACVPTAGIYLLIPGFAMVLMAGALLLSLPRLLRRSRTTLLPLGGLQRRLLPWVVLAILNFFVVVQILGLAVEGDLSELPLSTSEVGLLPDQTVGVIVVTVVAGLGALRLLFAAGLRLGRMRRITADGLLLVYVAAVLLQRSLQKNGEDALLAAPALAILLAEGAMALVQAAFNRVQRRR